MTKAYHIGDMVTWWSHISFSDEVGYVIATDGQGTKSLRIRFFAGYDRIVYIDHRLNKAKV